MSSWRPRCLDGIAGTAADEQSLWYFPEDNLKALARYHSVVPMREAVDMLAGDSEWKPNCAVITFDDSIECTLRVAAPLLLEMGMTATVFVSTQILEDGIPYWWLRLDFAWHHAVNPRAEVFLQDGSVLVLEKGQLQSLRRLKASLRKTPEPERERIIVALEQDLGCRLSDPEKQYPFSKPLTWEGVHELDRMGFDIGSHTVSHPNLPLVDPEEMKREMIQSKLAIERQLQKECRHFCYPYGGCRSRLNLQQER